jgi:hypothetical protein
LTIGVRGLVVHVNCVRVKRELPKPEFPISERKSIDSSGPRETEGPGGSSLLGEGQVASIDTFVRKVSNSATVETFER